MISKESSSKVTDEELYLLAVKDTCEKSFKSFVKYFFKKQYGKSFSWAWHHQKIANVLMDVYYGRKTHVIINIPPRYSKTELIVKMFNAWTYALNPKCASIHLSYSEPLALSNSSKIIELINSPAYQALWPNSKIPKNKSSKKEWETISGGTFKAGPAGGTVTGFGAGSLSDIDCHGEYTYSGGIFIDDPLKPDDAKHETIRVGTNDRWDETIKNRRNSPSTPVVVVMQRLHEDDFSAMLLDDKEFKWHQLVLPAILNENTDQEEALWPAMHTLEMLREMKKKNKYVFSGQYQQSPSPKGGGKIKEEWWSRYKSKDEIIQRCNFFFMTADTAYTSDNANDPSVIQLWGAESATRLYLVDQIKGYWEFPELLTNVTKFWNKHTVNINHRPPAALYIESKASGLSLVQTLKRNGIPAKGWNPKHYKFPIDKVGRVNESSWNIMSGDIWIPMEAYWVQGFIDEWSKFTNNDTHKEDDQIDAGTMAISIWRKFGGGTTTE